MNVHPDTLRQGVPTMHPNLMGQPFLPQQPQQGQQPAPHSMAFLQNNQGVNPGLGLMGGQPSASNPNYPLNMQQGPHRRTVYMPQHGVGPPGTAGPSHMANLGPNQLQNMQNMQNMAGFPGSNMIPQQTIRRVHSQPLGQPGAPMGGMQPGMQPGMIGGGIGLSGPQMGGMRGGMTSAHLQLRQPPQQQQQQQHGPGGGMGQDMGLAMNRPGPGHMPGANGIPPHVRAPSGQQLMPTLTQPSPLQQSHGMQQGPVQHNAFGNPMSLSHQQSQLGSGGQQQLGANMAGNSMAQQVSGNRTQMTSDNNMFMNFQNQPIQPPLPHGVPRMPMGQHDSRFHIAPSPTPLSSGNDMSQRGSAPMNPSGPMTPAQVLEMNAGGGEGFPTGSYGMAQPQVSAPPRPSSHNGPHNHPHNPFPMSQSQPSHPPQQSPRTTSIHPTAPTMQRPQSQPQAAHRQSPIPPGPSRTPRVAQMSLPAGGMLPPTRVPTATGQSPQGPSHQPTQPPASAPPPPQTVQQIAPRPPSSMTAQAGAGTQTASTGTVPPSTPQNGEPEGNQRPIASTTTPTSAPASVPLPPTTQRPTIFPIGFGQGVNRVLQLSGSLGVESKERFNMAHWQHLVSTFFTESATMKLTLWKDNQHVEAKPFEIGYPIFPRFFLVTSQSGVKSQTISIDGARERMLKPSHAVIECPTAAWTFRYTNGYSITLRGPLTAEVIVQAIPQPPSAATGGPQNHYQLKLDKLKFDAFWHDKYLALDAIRGERILDSPRVMPMSPVGAQTINQANHNGLEDRHSPDRQDEPRYLIDQAIIPQEPINAFGIPQATMRCLELAESVAQMSDLIQFSVSNKLGPVAALTALADKIRKENGRDYNRSHGGNVAGPTPWPNSNGAPAGVPGPSGTFAGMQNTAGPSHPLTGGDQQNAAQADGPSKAGKAAPPSAQASGSTPSAQASTPASAPTPGGPTTPSIANATLKRKAPSSQRSGEDSPTTANAEQQPAAKRVNRKRGRTQGS